MEIPRYAAHKIHFWAREQQWPEGTELENPSDYHVTLMYTPSGYDEHKEAWWLEHLEHAEVTVTGIDAFPAQEKGYAYVLRLDADEVKEHAEEMQRRAEGMGLEITHFPGGFKPHLTVAYGPSQSLPGVKAPNFQFDIGPSSVSPPRKKESAFERLAKTLKVKPYKPGRYGKGMIQSERDPEALIWRVKGGWNGSPHHDEVSETLGIERPSVAFHIDVDGKFYFHQEDDGFVPPEDPTGLAKEIESQYSNLTWGKISVEEYERQNGKTGRLNKQAGEPESPPDYRPMEKRDEHCANCLMNFHGRCWGYGKLENGKVDDYPVEADHVCDSWTMDPQGNKTAAREPYNPDEVSVLDHLSLASVAHNIHYRFEQGGLDAAGATDYARRMLRMIGYPEDDMTIQAALQAWQELYPQDRLLEGGAQRGELTAPATVPQESYGNGTTSKRRWVPEKIVARVRELSQTLRQTRVGGMEQEVDDTGLLAGTEARTAQSFGQTSPELSDILNAFGDRFGVTVLANEDPREVSFDHIEIPSHNRGQGVGHRVMNQLKSYCDRNGKGLRVEHVVNQPFFQSLGWMTPSGPDEFSYEPMAADNPWASTVPSQVNNPDDNWSEYAKPLPPEKQMHDVQFSNDWNWHQ